MNICIICKRLCHNNLCNECILKMKREMEKEKIFRMTLLIICAALGGIVWAMVLLEWKK